MRKSIVALLLALCATQAWGQPAPADLVLRNGVILTVDPADQVVQALAVRDGRIVATGSDQSMAALIGPKTEVIDLAGRTATPGLIDTHAHLMKGGVSELFNINLTRTTSIKDLLDLVKARAAAAPPGSWLQGSGWNEGLLAEHRAPTLVELDAVSGDHPLSLMNTTAHYIVVNSAALALAHIDAATPDPPGGTIDRDAQGRATGLLKENAKALVAKLIPPVTRQQDHASLRAMITQMHGEGMTGVKDPLLSPEEWADYVALARTESLAIHACGLIFAGETLESAQKALAVVKAGQRDVAALPGGDLGMCGVKMMLDGSAMARTAWMNNDYATDPAHPPPTGSGYPIGDPAVYREMVKLFVRADVPIGTHVIGDRAIDVAVDAYAEALKETPKTGLRLSLIHAHIPTDHALTVMAELQRRYDSGVPEVQGEFLWWLGDALPGAFGPERSARTMPLATYRRRGMIFASGSDYPVTPLAARYGLWASVARQPLKGVYGAQPFGVAEAVDVHTALRSYTIWAARQLFIERQTGSLEVGKWADIAIWDQNPYAVPTAALKDIRCEMTLYKGKVVFKR